MLLNPNDLGKNLDRLEEIEKTTLRLVTQALLDYRVVAADIFRAEADLVSDIGEDITREAMDRLGMPRIDQRLFGKVDYKRACYLFHPDYVVKQALFVDSKAEKVSGAATATLQTSQFSMTVRQDRSGKEVIEAGKLPKTLVVKGEVYLTTTIFVKYSYDDENSVNALRSIVVAALPNGMLQSRYNSDPQNTIWLAGRNAPTLGIGLTCEAWGAKCYWVLEEELYQTLAEQHRFEVGRYSPDDPVRFAMYDLVPQNGHLVLKLVRFASVSMKEIDSALRKSQIPMSRDEFVESLDRQWAISMKRELYAAIARKTRSLPSIGP